MIATNQPLEIRGRLGYTLAETMSRRDKNNVNGSMVKRGFLHLIAIYRQSSSAFWYDGCFEFAAAMSFWILLGIIPMLFLVLFVAGIVFRANPELVKMLSDYVQGSLPAYSKFVMAEVTNISQSTATLGIWTLVFYVLFMLWIVSFTVDSVDYSLCRVFKCEEHRSFFQSKRLSLILIPLIGFLIFASASITAVIDFVAARTVAKWWTFGRVLVYGVLIKSVLPFVMMIVTLTLMYKMVPNTKVRWRSAAFGGAFGALFWEVAKNVFSNVTSHNPAYGFIWGSMHALILFLILVYFFSCVFLFCAELAAHLDRMINGPADQIKGL